MEGALFVPEVRRLQITVLTLQFYDQSVQCTYFHVDSSHLWWLLYFFLELHHRRMLRFIMRPTSVWQRCLLNQTWRYMLR